MPCYHPKYAQLELIRDKETGEIKQHLKFLKYFKFEDYDRKEEYKKNVVSIPCGKCIGCRLEYAKQWANRCQMEAKNSQYNYFVTLTYDDIDIPKSGPNYTLRKKDLSSFIKRLRTRLNRYYSEILGDKYEYINMRFLACGEYGDNTLRPHYHAILFNCPLPDLVNEFPYMDPLTGEMKKISTTSKKGNQLKYSELLASCWNKGQISIGECTWETCNYVARYVVKKAGTVSKKDFENIGIEAPFLLMSRRPGIGADYLSENMEKIYLTDEIFCLKSTGESIAAKPPRYLDKLAEKVGFSQLEEVKKQRVESMRNQIDLELSNKEGNFDDRSHEVRLNQAEQCHEARSKILRNRQLT